LSRVDNDVIFGSNIAQYRVSREDLMGHYEKSTRMLTTLEDSAEAASNRLRYDCANQSCSNSVPIGDHRNPSLYADNVVVLRTSTLENAFVQCSNFPQPHSKAEFDDLIVVLDYHNLTYQPLSAYAVR
jgi:hypothetical protein